MAISLGISWNFSHRNGHAGCLQLAVLGDKASKYWFRKKKWMSALIERIAKATYHQRFDTTPFGVFADRAIGRVKNLRADEVAA
jgi:hypothetical protein